MREDRCAVRVAVLHVELVRELVQDHVVTPVTLGRRPEHVVPREDNCPRGPRLAQPHLVAFGDQPVRRVFAAVDAECAGIDQDRREPAVIVLVAVQQQQACAGRDRHADLIGHLQPTRSLEPLLADEDLDATTKVRPIHLGKPRGERNVAGKDLVPGCRKRARGGLPPAQGADRVQPAHRLVFLLARANPSSPRAIHSLRAIGDQAVPHRSRRGPGNVTVTRYARHERTRNVSTAGAPDRGGRGHRARDRCLQRRGDGRHQRSGTVRGLRGTGDGGPVWLRAVLAWPVGLRLLRDHLLDLRHLSDLWPAPGHLRLGPMEWPWPGRGWGPRGGGRREMVEEWHRELHRREEGVDGAEGHAAP